MRMMKFAPIAVLLLLMPLQAAAEAIDETRAVDADGTVVVTNVAGNISITVWDREEAHISGTLGTNQELVITETANGIQFEVESIDDDLDSDESEIELTVPAGASLDVNGVSADITISGSAGASINAESISGDVTVESDSDRIELSSVSGDLEFSGSSSRSSAETVSGDISLEGIDGEVTISTVSGDAEVVAGDVDLGKFETVSGSLNLDMAVTTGGRLTVEGMNGDVEVLLPSSQQGTFSAQTFSGDITSDFGEPKSESFGPGSHLKYTTGDSGTTIRVETFSGDIDIGNK
jgi:DUF4097 and DUF4098 domain-containing protein YvlB